MCKKALHLMWFLFVIFCNQAGATTWNTADDFSTSNGNPNGVWSYGYFNSDYSTFTLYNQPGSPPSPMLNWTVSGDPDTHGNCNYNTSDTTYTRIDWGPGMSFRGYQSCVMTTYPGSSERPVFRFTAPAADYYALDVEFENRVMSGDATTVRVRVDGDEVYTDTVSGFESGSANYSYYYDDGIYLAANDTIELAVSGTELHQVGVNASITNSLSAPDTATDPSPANSVTGVVLNATLNWKRGLWSSSQDVYLGTSYSAVNNATTASDEFMGNQTGNTYTPASELSGSTTYYWRIDERNSEGVTKGVVWSFTTVSMSLWDYADDFSTGNGNPNGVWSYGYFNSDYSTFTLYNQPGASAPMINWTVNGDPDTHGNCNYNTSVTTYVRTDWGPGMSFRGYKVCCMTPQTSGEKCAVRWTAPSASIYILDVQFENRVISGDSTGVFIRINGSEVFSDTLSGYMAASSLTGYFDPNVSLNANDTIEVGVTGTAFHQVGMDVYLAYSNALPLAGTTPIPEDDTLTVNEEPDLEWNRGAFATSYDVYIGTTYSAVANAYTGSSEYQGNYTTTDGKQAYYPVNLNHDTTYYWRIDQKNDNGITAGTVWKFTTQEADTEPNEVLEMEWANDFRDERFTDPAYNSPPFEFTYNGSLFSNLLSSWGSPSRSYQILDSNRTQWTLVYNEPSPGSLRVTCQMIEYSDYPALEWVLAFENTGYSNTPILEDVYALYLNESCSGNPVNSGEPVEIWQASEDWGTELSNPQGTWNYYGGWVASCSLLNTFDDTTYPGLEMWTDGGGAPWVAVNTSGSNVSVGGTAVEPGQMVMMPGSTALSDSPAVSWKCPQTGLYNISGTVDNIGSGGDGISWNLHNFNWEIIDSGDIGDQGTDSFSLTNYPVVKGEQLCFIFCAKTSTTGDLTAIDFSVTEAFTPWSGDFQVHHAAGSCPTDNDFQPVMWGMGPNTTVPLSAQQGRSSEEVAVPFFNVKRPDGSGNIIGIGWTGQWAATFARDSGSTLNIKAGMETTHLELQPGEVIRTPSILLTFWNGNRRHGQNQLRRLLRDHYSPTPGGEKVQPPVAASPILDSNADVDDVIAFISDCGQNNLPVDTIWIDAGWYDCDGDWTKTGTWEPDPVKFPNGLGPVGSAAAANGYNFLLWFEPERVVPDTWLADYHQDWLLGSSGGWQLLNMGNPDAWNWATVTFSGLINDYGVNIYRQDFNHYPLQYWTDISTRQGITEIKYITGMYDYLDYLLQQNPDLLIDNCASGGKRIDLEMLKRSLILWRSDNCWNPENEQGFTYGLSDWIPYTGRGSTSLDKYTFRSGMGSHFSFAFNNAGISWAEAATRLNELWEVINLYEGDFYPFTPYSLSGEVWVAWQYNCPETNEGLVQAFRHTDSSVSTMNFQLKGLDAGITYKVKNLDGATTQKSGSELMNDGLNVTISSPRDSALIKYYKDAVVVVNAAATNITSTSATLNGEVTYTSGLAPNVYIYWGDNDGGTIPGNWDHCETLGTRDLGTFSQGISGLTANTAYYFRCYAINADGENWALSTVYSLNADANCSDYTIGNWSYGWGEGVSDFSGMDYKVENATGWYQDSRNSAGGSLSPQVWFNDTEDAIYGVPPGWHAVHTSSEDSAGEWTKLRFTAPQNLDPVTIAGTIGAGDGTEVYGKVDAKVVKNAGEVDEAVLWTVYDAAVDTPFSLTSSMDTEETIDLIVGRGSDTYYYDSTNVAFAVIADQAGSLQFTTPNSVTYTEKFQQFSAGSADSWVDVNLSGYGVGDGDIVEIGIRNSYASAEYWGGVRANGSSVDRRVQLHEAESGGCDMVTMHVKADANGTIEVYADNTTYNVFYLLGIWSSSDYTEKFQSFNAGSTGSWVDADLSGYGVGASAMVEVMIVNNSGSYEYEGGIRANGSNLSRKVDIHEAESGGDDVCVMLAQADASGKIEVYAENASVNFVLLGYWTAAPGTYTERFVSVGKPASNNTWSDLDLTASGVPDNAICEMLMCNGDENNENSMGVRSNGSSLGRVFALQESEGGGRDCGRMHVSSDGNAVIEQYMANVSGTGEFYLLGYWE